MKKKLIALVLMFALVLTFGLVACKEAEGASFTTMAANYGHNGVTFTEVTVNASGKITKVYLDEIEWSSYNGFYCDDNWATGHGVAAGDIVTSGTIDIAKKIELSGVKFTWNGTNYVSDTKLMFNRQTNLFVKNGSMTVTLPAAAGNANAYEWTNEIALHVTNSMRSGEYYILKADGTRYNVTFQRACHAENTAHIGTAAEGQPHNGTGASSCGKGSGEHNGETLTKNQLFVKSYYYPRRNASGGREDQGLVDATQLSFDANMKAITDWVVAQGTLPANLWNTARSDNQPYGVAADKPAAADAGVTRPANAGELANTWYFGGVTTGATFNDWNWYMFAMLKAYQINPNAK